MQGVFGGGKFGGYGSFDSAALAQDDREETIPGKERQ